MKHEPPARRHLQRSVLSPFRYPGGKSWLWPVIRAWLNPPVKMLVEPFAGGANTTLTAVSENLAENATMIELDPEVACVWNVVFNGQSDWLAKQISDFHITRTAVKTVLSRRARSMRQMAWQTIVRNRVNHGGILAEGAGLLRKGERQNGIKSRWYPKTLSTRIAAVNSLKTRIAFVEGDGLQWLETNLAKPELKFAAFFIDPPYQTAGQRLYAYNELNHRRVFEIASRLPGRVLMTYENSREIRALAVEFGFESRKVGMISRQHARKKELLISKDLSWLTKAALVKKSP